MKKYEAKNLETIQSVMNNLRALSRKNGYTYYSVFNGKKVFSTDTDDEAYKRVGLKSVEDLEFYKKCCDSNLDSGVKDYITRIFHEGTDEKWSEVKIRFKDEI